MDTVLADKQDWHAPAIDLLIKSRSDGVCFHIIFTVVDIVFVEKANRGLAGGAPGSTIIKTSGAPSIFTEPALLTC